MPAERNSTQPNGYRLINDPLGLLGGCMDVKHTPEMAGELVHARLARKWDNNPCATVSSVFAAQREIFLDMSGMFSYFEHESGSVAGVKFFPI